VQTEAVFGISLDNVVVFILTTFRIGGMFVAAPILGHSAIPATVKILLSLALGYFLFPLTSTQLFALDAGLLPLFTLAMQEFLLGLIIGFLFQIIFWGVEFGGGLIGYQIGFAMVNIVDPTTSANVPIIGQFKLLIATLIFFLINGHHVMLQALFESFRMVPLGHIVFRPANLVEFTKLAGAAFIIGIKVSAPVIVTLFITDVCLGIIARTMPQMNILVVGFQVKIFAGLLVLGISLPVFNYVFTQLFSRLSIDAFQITKGFAG
jgi:flagellar biosynthetic protein FliR